MSLGRSHLGPMRCTGTRWYSRRAAKTFGTDRKNSYAAASNLTLETRKAVIVGHVDIGISQAGHDVWSIGQLQVKALCITQPQPQEPDDENENFTHVAIGATIDGGDVNHSGDELLFNLLNK